MEYTQIGRSGLRVSRQILGAMNFGAATDRETSGQIINEALDAGINAIDTADCYSHGLSEEIVGETLAQNGRRDDVVIATKFTTHMGQGPNDWGQSRYHIVQACEASLRRLKTDRIDLYQAHWMDMVTPLEEMLRALDDLVRQGKVRYIGVSKFACALIAEAALLARQYGWTPLTSEQPPYNILDRSIERELVWTCKRYGLGIIPWGPLASGILSGRYRRGNIPKDSRSAQHGIGPTRMSKGALKAVEALLPLAEGKGVTLAEFSLAWLLHQPGVSAALIGPRTPEHLHSCLKAVDVKLSEADLKAVDEINPPGHSLSAYHSENVDARLRKDIFGNP